MEFASGSAATQLTQTGKHFYVTFWRTIWTFKVEAILAPYGADSKKPFFEYVQVIGDGENLTGHGGVLVDLSVNDVLNHGRVFSSYEAARQAIR